MDKIKIGISIGDINGIGLEVILKTLFNKRILDICTPFVYSSTKVVSYHKNIVGIDLQFNSTKSADRFANNRVNVVNCWNDNVNITLGQATELGGKYAFKSLEAAVKDLQHGMTDAIVTAPINKEAMKLAGFPFPGHTEYLAEQFNAKDHLMLMVNSGLRIGVVTGHIALSEVTQKLNKQLISRKLNLLNEALKIDFGIERPTIAVLGLNPHASDGGLMGTEEDKMIRPAIIEAKKQGMAVMGPYAADGFFGSGMHKKFDAILAMYHDQGLIPFKALSFGEGVNYTAGLSAVRTSPDHGTAFDIVGKNEADFSSFRQALFTAIDVARNRKEHVEMHENRLTKRADKLKQTDQKVEDVVEEN